MREKVLIIGGTGFIGSHILKTFSNKNYKLYSLSKKKIKNFKKIKNVKYIFSDVSKLNKLKNISEKQFDHIVNLCGYVDHKNKKENNSCHFEGSKNVAKVFNSYKLKTFIQVGSSLEYGRLKSPQKEKRLCKPIGVYGVSKYKASKFLQNFKKSKKFPYIILRPYQVYGPYQKKNRLIPLTIDACLKNQNFNCTSGKQLRDFIYIDDFCDLIVKIIKKKEIRRETFNIGSGKPVSVKFIIKKIQSLIKKGKPKFGFVKMRLDETQNLYPSIEKVKKKFGWSPKVTLIRGLKKTILSYEIR